LLGEYDAGGALKAEHVWLGDTPVALIVPAAFGASHGGISAGSESALFVEPDSLDTPRAIVNATHQVVWRWDSAPFGDSLANENPAGLGALAYSLRFPGQQFDPETQTYYNVFRDYQPASGRYIQADPTGLESGTNPYAYLDGGPLDGSDDFGLARCPKIIARWCKKRPPKPHRPNLKPPPGGGLYIVRDCKGTVVYVGQTNSFSSRSNSHCGYGGQFSAFNQKCCPISVFFVPMPKGPGLDKLEQKVIGQYRPPGNTQHNPTPNSYAPPKCC